MEKLRIIWQYIRLWDERRDTKWQQKWARLDIRLVESDLRVSVGVSYKFYLWSVRCDIIHILALRKLQHFCHIQRGQNVLLYNVFQCFKLSDEYLKLLTTYRIGRRDSAKTLYWKTLCHTVTVSVFNIFWLLYCVCAGASVCVVSSAILANKRDHVDWRIWWCRSREWHESIWDCEMKEEIWSECKSELDSTFSSFSCNWTECSIV